MYQGDNYTLMADYNAWRNGKLYKAAAGLPDAERKRDLGAFFKSLHGTLNHILVVDLMFLARFTGQPLPATGLDEDRHDDFGDLRAERPGQRAVLQWRIKKSAPHNKPPFFRVQAGIGCCSEVH